MTNDKFSNIIHCSLFSVIDSEWLAFAIAGFSPDGAKSIAGFVMDLSSDSSRVARGVGYSTAIECEQPKYPLKETAQKWG